MKTTTPHDERIKQELKKAGVTSYGLLKGESRRLPSIIHEDEHIGGVVYGRTADVSAMLVATNLRVIFLDSKPFFSTMDELTYDVISGLKLSKSVPFSAITLHTRLGDYVLRFVNARCSKIFVTYVENQRIERARAGKANTGQLPRQPSPVEQSIGDEGLSFLQSHDTAVLSTVSRTGYVSGAVIHYVFQNGKVYILTRSETSKGRNVYAHGQVALTVHQTGTLQTLQLQGMAEVETDPAMKRTIIDQMIRPRPYGDEMHDPPVTKLKEGSFMVIKITLTTMKFRDYLNHGTD